MPFKISRSTLGYSKSAEPPPEIAKMTRSSDVALFIISIARFAAFTLSAFGKG
jgi:hypothetical protein